MEQLFLELLNRSIQASFLIVVILLLRFLLKRNPKWMQCFLWALLAVKLICPISIESNFSLVPSAKIIDSDIYEGRLNFQLGITRIDNSVNEYLENYYQEELETSESDLKKKENFSILKIVSFVWGFGIAVFAIYTLISYIKIRNQVKVSICIQDNIFICDRISTPFILGMIKPHIYLPSDLNENQMKCIVAHERAHLKRFDHIWKPFAFLLLFLYWFHPLCWISYILFCRDMELACDEKVIKDMNLEQKKNYSKVLLSFSVSEKNISVCPLAFGEVGVKERIKAVLNYKKPKFIFIVLTMIVIIMISVFFLTNPKNHSEKYDSSVSGLVEEEKVDNKRIEIHEAVIDLNAPTGSDGSRIYYADKDKFIFGGYYGLFVYDMQENQIVRSVDLEEIGCNYTQGENACEILVTEDGMTVLLRPLVMNQMYVYSVNENAMWMEPDDLKNYNFYKSKQIEDGGLEEGKYASFVENGEERFIFLVNDMILGELGYALDAESKVQKIFGDNVKNNINPNTATNSRNSDGTPSRAYIDYLQEKISEDMINGELPFVVSSAIMEDPLRLEVRVLELTEENINKILSYENNGPAITILKGEAAILE